MEEQPIPTNLHNSKEGREKGMMMQRIVVEMASGIALTPCKKSKEKTYYTPVFASEQKVARISLISSLE